MPWGDEAQRTYGACASFEATYRALWSPVRGRERALRLWVAAEGKRRLRLEIAGRMGGSWLTVVARDGELLAVSARSGEHARQALDAAALERLTGWPLRPAEVAGVLLADLPARLGLPVEASARDPQAEPPAHAAAGPDAPRARTERAAAAGREYLRGRLLPPAAADSLLIEQDGRRVAEVAYEAWAEHGAARVPERLVLRAPAGTLTLWLEDLSSAPPPAAAFALDPPAGSRRVHLDSGAPDAPYWGMPEEEP